MDVILLDQLIMFLSVFLGGGEGGGGGVFFMKAEFNMSDLVSEYQQYQDATKRKRQKANINFLSSVNTQYLHILYTCLLPSELIY